jgi:REP element-mobilizing transposase RayT
MTFYRRRLPHWLPEREDIFLTWRLFGSLPAEVSQDISKLDSRRYGERFRAIDRRLDRCKDGPLWLKDPRIAEHVVCTIQKGERELHAYALHAFIVMPNHVHMLISPMVPLARITKGLKGSTARFANRCLTSARKHFWQDESFDHWVRTPEQFEKIARYIENNSCSAGLVSRAELWPWSSASRPKTSLT